MGRQGDIHEGHRGRRGTGVASGGHRGRGGHRRAQGSHLDNPQNRHIGHRGRIWTIHKTGINVQFAEATLRRSKCAICRRDPSTFLQEFVRCLYVDRDDRGHRGRVWTIHKTAEMCNLQTRPFGLLEMCNLQTRPFGLLRTSLEGIERQVNLRMAAVRSRDAGYPAPPHRSLGLKGSKGERRRGEA